MSLTRKLIFTAVARNLALTLLATASLFGFSPSVYALSAGCTTLNAQSGTTSFSRSFAAGSFDPGDTLTVSFSDNGSNVGNSNPSSADSVILRNPTTFTAYYDYRSNTGSGGSHTGGATSSQLTGGAFVSIKAGTYLSAVSISCGSAVSSDATLSNLIPSTGTLSPSFSPGTTSYSISVANSVSSIGFTPIASSGNATINVGSNTVVSGAASPTIGLSEGTNPISISVTAQDGTTTNLYSVSVLRAVAVPISNAVTATVSANSSNNIVTLSNSGGAYTSAAVSVNASHGNAVATGTSIYYTPTAGYSGVDSFQYTLSNGAGNSQSATVTVTVTAPLLALSPAAGTLNSGQMGVAYNQFFSASSGTAPYSYVATGVPPGLIFDPSNGHLSGIPSSSGTYNLSVTATDHFGATGSANYTLNVAAAALPVANPVSATVSANTSNAVSVALSGGTATFVTVASAPMHGIAVASGTSITYTPNAGYSGVDSFTYTASNGSGTSAPAVVTLTVTSPTLVLTPTSGTLTSAQVGGTYSQSFSASGGSAPYSYVGSGLPVGMNLDSISGLLSGSPTGTGTFNLSVTVTDSHGATGSANYTLNVAAGALPVANPVSTTVVANSSGAVALSISGGTATAVAVVTPPSHGSTAVSGTSIFYTPVVGFAGTDSFRYTASNASGTSPAATVSITVAPSVLTVSPAGSELPSATVGVAYSQLISVSGGATPYHFVAAGLPAGLIIDASSGVISGMPTTSGTANVLVTVSDNTGTSAKVPYSLTVNGSVPSGADRSTSLLAGQSLTVDLTDNISGGPFTQASLLDIPPRAMGQVSLNGMNLTFLAAAQASGATVIHYTLSNRWGTSQPIALSVQITGRSDPSKDPEVIGMVGAQAQSSTRFARAQIDNFNDRLEQLHDDESRRNRGFNLQLGLPQSRPSRTGNTSAAEMYQALSSLSGNDAPAIERHAAAGEQDGWLGDDNLALWSGGYVNVSDTHRDDVKFDSTMVGVSAGADYRFFDTFTAGIGFGYGSDSSDIGSRDSRSKGRSFSTALYGSLHPGRIFVDGLLGYSSLSFDSRRYVTDNGGRAKGSRDGDQIFGSLSSGYEFRDENWKVAPYGRMDISSTKLDGFRESGSGIYDLAYAEQRMTVFSGVGGVRVQYGIPLTQSAVTLRGRVEYSHTFSGDSTARVGYADVSDSTYAISTVGQSENIMTVALGLDFLLSSGVSTGLTYQGSYGLGDDSRSNALMFRVGSRF